MAADDLLEGLRSARIYDLEQPRYHGAPTYPSHVPGFLYSLHRRHEPDTGETRTSASGLVVMAEHSGTHIDALCHQAENMRMHGDVEVNSRVQTSTGFAELGAETIPSFLVRGVLLDVAGAAGVERLPPQPSIRASQLARAADAQGITVHDGDAVLVRTGNGALWEHVEEYAAGPGIAPDASWWLAEHRASVVGSDNLAWDDPDYLDPELGRLPGHVVLIVRSGIYIIENLFLEELARDGRFEFAFVCVPLKMRGATGSPVRPMALC